MFNTDKPYQDRDLGGSSASPEPGGVEPDLLEPALVRPIARALVKAIQASRLYPEDNPGYLRAREAFGDLVLRTLEDQESLRLIVDRSSLSYAGETVLEDEKESGLAAWLHREGIRELTFHRGLDAEQTARFLSVFRDVSGGGKESAELAAGLWDEGLSHISYIVIDELFDPQKDGQSAPTEFGREFREQPGGGTQASAKESTTSERAAKQAERVLAQVQAGDIGLFGVSEEERAAVLRELDEEKAPGRIEQDFARILVQVLLLEEEETEFVSLVEVAAERIASSVREGQLEEAGRLVSILVEVEAGGTLESKTCHRALTAALRSAWDRDNLESIRSRLDEGHAETMAGLKDFVTTIPDADVVQACLMLGTLETASARHRLIDIIVDRCRHQPQILLPLLRDKRWYLVRNAALILGRIGDCTMGPPLQPLLRHEDRRVRREALAAIDLIDPTRADALLQDALVDREVRVRIFAAGRLATRGPSASKTLVEAILSKDFEKRDDTEIGAFYEALGHMGGPEVIAFLVKMTSRRNFWRRQKVDAVRAAACHALGRAGGPVAQETLRRRLRDRSEVVRNSARSALDHLSTEDERMAA